MYRPSWHGCRPQIAKELPCVAYVPLGARMGFIYNQVVEILCFAVGRIQIVFLFFNGFTPLFEILQRHTSFRPGRVELVNFCSSPTQCRVQCARKLEDAEAI